MTLCTDEKKPTGSTNPPAGRTDSAIVPRSIRIIKAVIIYAVIAVAASSCMDVVRSNAVNCAEAFCDQ